MRLYSYSLIQKKALASLAQLYPRAEELFVHHLQSKFSSGNQLLKQKRHRKFCKFWLNPKLK